MKDFKVGDTVIVHKLGEFSKVSDGEVIKVTKTILTVKVKEWDNQVIEFNRATLNEKGYSKKRSFYYIQNWD